MTIIIQQHRRTVYSILVALMLYLALRPQPQHSGSNQIFLFASGLSSSPRTWTRRVRRMLLLSSSSSSSSESPSGAESPASTTNRRQRGLRSLRRPAAASSVLGTGSTAAASTTTSTTPTPATNEVRPKRSSIVRRRETVLFFPTCGAQCQKSNDNNNNTTLSSTWDVPIHGWIFDGDQVHKGFRRRAFLALLQSALQRSSSSSSGNNQNSDHDNEESARRLTHNNSMLDHDSHEEDEDDEDDNDEDVPALSTEEQEALEKQETDMLRQVFSQEYIKTAKEVLSRRVLPFIVDNHRGRKISIRFLKANIDENTHHDSKPNATPNNKNITTTILQKELLPPSRKNGHFQATLSLTDEELRDIRQPIPGTSHHLIRFQAVTGIKNDTRVFEGTTLLVNENDHETKAGNNQRQHNRKPVYSVISDLDDTVKISNVLEKKKLLRHTFLEEFEAVPGMADVYQKWKHEHDACFHFVSSSPWQLYEEIASFLKRAGFPMEVSTFHLKPIRLKDRTLLHLLADPRESKITKISHILDMYPRRSFVLVGDTGERDPEVYGEVCRRYPHQIHRVFLRDVTSDLDEELIREKNKKAAKKGSDVRLNDPERFHKAFAEVPEEKWVVFTDASTLQL